MKIKVCGMTKGKNILAVEKLGVDMMGFIFYNKSTRFVKEIPSYLPHKCKRVGVFVNSGISSILEKVSIYNLDYIQLHGDEDAIFCKELRTSLPSKIKIIKCIHISSIKDIDKAIYYEPFVDINLFENKSIGYGGSGKKFDWAHLDAYTSQKPFILSGGIGPDDYDFLLNFHHPLFLGIDINSLFETSPGIKNIKLLQTFIKKIRNEQNQPIIQKKAK